VAGQTLHIRRAVLATGARAARPQIPGLEEAGYQTNETIFSLTRLPPRLAVIGGGPIGCELAQAFRRLGSDVTVVEMARLLHKDDPDAAALVRDRLKAEGVRLLEETKVMHAVGAEGAITLALDGRNGPQIVTGSHLLVAAGRKANFAGLELEKAGIAATPQGITVDAGLRTSNRRVFAIGDVIGGLQFTHAASYHAGIVIRRALFRLPAKMNPGAIPWVTYTDPELAQAGETEAGARQKGLDIAVTVSPFARNDRAQTERDSDGFVKVISTKKGRILGTTIVGAQAGELIQVWCLAIAQGLRLSAMAGMVAPYPTRGEAGKRAAGDFYTPRLFSDRTRRLVKFLRLFG
jgi:pyruvate/2-oxoglutarate dehydrogenase complex dihydrolipoamide dehydrogenase (E3) component